MSCSKVDKIYSLIKKTDGNLGGGGYNASIYGEITKHSMQKIIDFLIDKCALSHDSTFLDIGSGLGKPNFHVIAYALPRLSIGIEEIDLRHMVLCLYKIIF